MAFPVEKRGVLGDENRAEFEQMRLQPAPRLDLVASKCCFPRQKAAFPL
jgi:hypothetical protein